VTKPNLLYITPVAPIPTGGGLAMRAYHNLLALAGKFSIYLLIVPPGESYLAYLSFSIVSPDDLYSCWALSRFSCVSEINSHQGVGKTCSTGADKSSRAKIRVTEKDKSRGSGIPRNRL